MISQTAEILAHLKSGRSITASHAMNHYRVYRLAARICDLRRDGHEIQSRTIRRRSKRTGRMVSFAEYNFMGEA